MYEKSQIQKFVEKGLLIEALDELLILSEGSEWNTYVISAKSAFSDAKRKYDAGILEYAEFHRIFNQTTFKIDSYRNEIASAKDKVPVHKRKTIFEQRKSLTSTDLQGTWLSYRHKIDFKNNLLDITNDEKNIFIVGLVFSPISDIQCSVRSIFITKIFIGTLTISGKRIFIELNEENGDKKVLVTLHISNDFFDSQQPILKGIANTYISDGETNNNPEIGVPLIFEKQVDEFSNIEEKTEYKSIEAIENESVKFFLQNDDRFISIYDFKKKPAENTRSNNNRLQKRILLSLIPILLGVFASIFWITTRNKIATEPQNVVIYSTIPKSVKFVWDEFEKFKAEIQNNFNGKINIVILPISTDSFPSLLKRVGREKSIALIGVPYYDTDDEGFVARTFFSTVPFGMKNHEFDYWIDSGAKKMFENIYRPDGVYPLPLGNTGHQAGGWFFEKIDTITKFEKRKIRIYGPGGEVLKSFGAVRVYGLPNKQKALDWSEDPEMLGFEAINAAVDESLGLYDAAIEIAKRKKRKIYYYAFGWHEPNSTYTLFLNRDFVSSIKIQPTEWYQFELIVRKYHAIISDKFEVEGQKTLIATAKWF